MLFTEQRDCILICNSQFSFPAGRGCYKNICFLSPRSQEPVGETEQLGQQGKYQHDSPLAGFRGVLKARKQMQLTSNKSIWGETHPPTPPLPHFPVPALPPFTPAKSTNTLLFWHSLQTFHEIKKLYAHWLSPEKG